MSVPLFAIGPAPLALEPLVSAVASESDGVDGAITTFRVSCEITTRAGVQYLGIACDRWR